MPKKYLELYKQSAYFVEIINKVLMTIILSVKIILYFGGTGYEA
jgi:hypothetical protein